jgi:anthranilate synthase component 1
MYVPSLADFRHKARQGNLVPVYREILADMETPVSAFLKIAEGDYGFLLESVEGGARVARYSFLGGLPARVLMCTGGSVTHLRPDSGTQQVAGVEDPFAELERLLSVYSPVAVEGLPRFHGGIVGYLAYDIVRHFERLPNAARDDAGLPDYVFLLTDTVLVFDHVRHRILVVSNAHVPSPADADAAYADATTRIESVIARLRQPLVAKTIGGRAELQEPMANMGREAYEGAVRRAKEYIAAGDAIQVVVSQRFTAPLAVDPFEFYRALRTVNPSPYMYFLRLGDIHIAGASPEMMVRVEDGIAETRPIAGTRPRGATAEEDTALAAELLADPKERAEHVMLVDLGRNDLGRVCEPGTVRVEEFMAVERYSHVMHLVSNVTGRLRKGMTAFDVVRAAFPAGTLSGAPKIRAMEIIDELEPTRRGPYGGAVGYFSFSGNADTAITIRTLVMHDGIASIQVGAGIVADSVPENEFQECRNKASAILRALEMAHRGLE